MEPVTTGLLIASLVASLAGTGAGVAANVEGKREKRKASDSRKKREEFEDEQAAAAHQEKRKAALSRAIGSDNLYGPGEYQTAPSIYEAQDSPWSTAQQALGGISQAAGTGAGISSKMVRPTSTLNKGVTGAGAEPAAPAPKTGIDYMNRPRRKFFS